MAEIWKEFRCPWTGQCVGQLLNTNTKWVDCSLSYGGAMWMSLRNSALNDRSKLWKTYVIWFYNTCGKIIFLKKYQGLKNPEPELYARGRGSREGRAPSGWALRLCNALRRMWGSRAPLVCVSHVVCT